MPNEPVSGTLAEFDDPFYPPLDLYSETVEMQAEVNWGDGTSDGETVVDEGGGTYAVTGEHTYLQEGPFVYAVELSDPRSGLGNSAVGLAWISKIADDQMDENVSVSSVSGLVAGSSLSGSDGGGSYDLTESGTLDDSLSYVIDRFDDQNGKTPGGLASLDVSASGLVDFTAVASGLDASALFTLSDGDLTTNNLSIDNSSAGGGGTLAVSTDFITGDLTTEMEGSGNGGVSVDFTGAGDSTGMTTWEMDTTQGYGTTATGSMQDGIFTETESDSCPTSRNVCRFLT